MWDAALADKETIEFQEELEKLRQYHREPEQPAAGLEALDALQALLQKYYRTTGHKRLARVFLKKSFE